MTVFAGDPATSDDINTIYDATIAKPIGRLVQTVAQTGIVNNTLTALTFTTEDFDTGNYHSTSSNTDRVTPTKAGKYRVRGSASIGGQTDFTTIEVVVTKNGTALAPACRITPSASSQTIVLPAEAYVTVNGTTDYFSVAYRAQRTGASTTATAISSQFASVLEWEFVEP